MALASARTAAAARRHRSARPLPSLQPGRRAHRAPAAADQWPGSASAEPRTRTVEVLERLSKGAEQSGGAGGGTTLEALRRVDAAWAAIRNGSGGGPVPEFVTQAASTLPAPPQYDVVVCGGTLGIFVASALQAAGLRCCVVERGPLVGREQEWNISRKEMAELVEMGVLTAEEVEECITSEFNPIRAGFNGGEPVVVRDILNLGVRPDMLVERARAAYEARGGAVLESTSLGGLRVCADGVAAEVEGGDEVTAVLALDCMGFGSPAVRQARGGAKPDGVCLVVGSCCRGFDPEKNVGGDLIYTCTDANSQGQYFWEAFPAGSGPSDRTTYMFSYLDANPGRPSLEHMLDDYWQLMPSYQGIGDIDDLEPLRVLFGFFPTYRDSPLKPQFDRVLQVGDASGIQSPLSFGGFGALTRHLPRLRAGICEAVSAGLVDREALGAINAYQPCLSGAWLFQRAMSIPPGADPGPRFINSLLSTNFAVMERLGDPVLRPFLQDVVQFGPLAQTMGGMMAKDPALTAKILLEVGPGPVADWARHFGALGAYTALHGLAAPAVKEAAGNERLPLSDRQRFQLRRMTEAWQYGAGLDYTM